MRDYAKFYIDGMWVDPVNPAWMDLVDPGTEEIHGRLALGGREDVNRAIIAARRAFTAYAGTSVDERKQLLRRILDVFTRRFDEFAEAMRLEMGSPIAFAKKGQAPRVPLHVNVLLDVLEHFSFEEDRGSTRLRYEPVGVCGLI